MTRPILLGVTAAAALAAVLAALALAAGGRGRAPAAGPPPLAFRPGAREVYRLHLESAVRFAGGGGEGPRQVRQLLDGELHLRVLDPGAEGARAALQLAGARLALEGASSPELDAQLGRPFLVVFAADGAPVRFEFPPAVGEQARAALEEAIRAFQVVVPAGAGATWTAEEAHATGRYRAAYRLTRDGRILKTKLGYVETAGGARVTVRRAEATVRIDRRGTWIERMVAEEDLAVSVSQGLFLPSSLRAELVRAPPPDLAQCLLELDEAPGTYGELSAWLAGLPAPPAAPGALPPPAGQPRPLAEIVAALNASPRLSARLVHELRELLLREPEAAGRLLALLRAGLPDRTAAAALNALGMAATPEAQAVLRTVADDAALGRMNRARAVVALGGGPELDEESLAALAALADGPRSDGLSSTALLALGMAGDTLRRGAPWRYPELRDALVQRAAAAREPGGAAAALLALGNTRDPALAAAAGARLDDPAPEVRAAAAQALAKLGGAADPDRLARRLALEDDGSVRFALAAALNALPPPGPDTLALLGAALGREEDPQARYELTRLLAANLDAYPAGRELLAALARRDPSRRVREAAASAIR